MIRKRLSPSLIQAKLPAPVFGRDLIKVGASGLGYLMAGAGLGAVISALTLAAQASAERKGKVIITSACVFALALILLAQARA